jgi:hypothetical protein
MIRHLISPMLRYNHETHEELPISEPEIQVKGMSWRGRWA